MDARKKAIFAFQFVKPILQTITHLVQYTVLEIRFCSVKCTTVTVTSKISSISIPSQQAMQATAMVYENKPLQKLLNWNEFMNVSKVLFNCLIYQQAELEQPPFSIYAMNVCNTTVLTRELKPLEAPFLSTNDPPFL